MGILAPFPEAYSQSWSSVTESHSITSSRFQTLRPPIFRLFNPQQGCSQYWVLKVSNAAPPLYLAACCSVTHSGIDSWRSLYSSFFWASLFQVSTVIPSYRGIAGRRSLNCSRHVLRADHMFPVLFQETPYPFYSGQAFSLFFHADNKTFKTVKLVVVKTFNSSQKPVFIWNFQYHPPYQQRYLKCTGNIKLSAINSVNSFQS